MEFEKASLKRQMELRFNNKNKAEAKLQFVEERIAALTRTLRDTADVETPRREKPLGHGDAGASRCGITLEY
jgi:hypothetical protein